MFTQLEPAVLKLTAAIGFDNLTAVTVGKSSTTWLAVHDLARVAVARVSDAGGGGGGGQVTTTSSILNPGKDEAMFGIAMVRMLRLLQQDKPFLVAATNKSVRVYSIESGDGCCSKLLFDHSFHHDPKQPGSRVHSIEKITKDTFCVGTQDHLRFFCVNSGSGGVTARDCFQDLKSSTNSAIHKFTALFGSSTPSSFALLENTGKVTVWKLSSEKNLTFSQHTSFDIHPNTRATCVQVYRNNLLIGTISGQIQIINTSDGQLVCEIQAHVKCVTSMDVAPGTGYLISGSEDSFVRMFKLSLAGEDDNDNSQPQIEYLQQIITPNEMVVGAKFLDQKGSMLAISTFESNQIKLFRLNDK